MLISASNPVTSLDTSKVQDSAVVEVFRNLLRGLDSLQLALCKVINNNDISQVSAVAQPAAPDAGRMILWLDTSGTAGHPKAKLIANISGTQVTFNSVETY